MKLNSVHLVVELSRGTVFQSQLALINQHEQKQGEENLKMKKEICV